MYFPSCSVKLFFSFFLPSSIKNNCAQVKNNAPAELQPFQGEKGPRSESEWLPGGRDPLEVLMKSVTLASQLYVSIHNPSPKKLTREPPTTPNGVPSLGRAGPCTDSCGTPVSYSQPERDLLSYICQGGQGQLSGNTHSSSPTSQTAAPDSLLRVPARRTLCLFFFFFLFGTYQDEMRHHDIRCGLFQRRR